MAFDSQVRKAPTRLHSSPHETVQAPSTVSSEPASHPVSPLRIYRAAMQVSKIGPEGCAGPVKKSTQMYSIMCKRSSSVTL